MSAVSTQAETVVEQQAEPTQQRRTRPTTKEKPKVQPPYAVILHNDPINGFEFVIGVLRKVLRCSGFRAMVLTTRAHVSGRAAVWAGSLEVAELKAEQIRAAGPDPSMVDRGAGPLSVSLEPVPG